MVCFLGWSIPYLHRMVQTCLHFSIKFLLVAKFHYCCSCKKSSTPPGMIVETPFKILAIFTVYLFISTHCRISSTFDSWAFPTGVGVKDKVYVIVMTWQRLRGPRKLRKSQWNVRKTSKKIEQCIYENPELWENCFYFLDILSICRGSSRLKNILRPW